MNYFSKFTMWLNLEGEEILKLPGILCYVKYKILFIIAVVETDIFYQVSFSMSFISLYVTYNTQHVSNNCTQEK